MGSQSVRHDRATEHVHTHTHTHTHSHTHTHTHTLMEAEDRSAVARGYRGERVNRQST